MQALQTVHKPPTVWKGYSPISNFNAHPTVQTPEVYFFHLPELFYATISGYVTFVTSVTFFNTFLPWALN